MKRLINLNWLLSGLLMTACVFTFTACSSDDDDDDGGGQLTTPTYAEDAVKFEIQDANSPYQSIELTPSGDYIVIKNGTNTPAFAKGIKAKSKKRAAESNSTANNIIIGKYTKNADGSFNLKDFATVTFSDNTVSIKGSNGTEITLNGNKVPKISDVNSNIFRTWKAIKYKIYYEGSEGKFEKEFNSFDELMKWSGDDGLDEDTGWEENEIWVRPNFEQIIISQYSTFAIACDVFRGNNTFLYKAFIPFPWKKTSANGGSILADPEDTDSEVFSFELKGNHLVVVYDESYEGEKEQLIITYNPA